MATVDSGLGPENGPKPKDIADGLEPDNILGMMIKEARETPLLTPAEEKELGEIIKTAKTAEKRLAEINLNKKEIKELQEKIKLGRQARERFIKANLRLVITEAWKYNNRGVDILDLIQAGNIGLIKAVDKFDYRRGCKFSTMAVHWIRSEIRKTLSDRDGSMTLPQEKRTMCREIYSARDRLEQELGRRPSNEELAKEMDWPLKEIEYLLRISAPVSSLDEPIMNTNGDNGKPLGDLLTDTTSLGPETEVVRRERADDLLKVLGGFSARDVRVVEAYFSDKYLTEGGNPNAAAVGRAFGITRERVRQIVGRVLTEIKSNPEILELLK